MGGVRIRWRALAKVAAVVVSAVGALQALPGLLRPPEPPPLAKDVGLRGIAVEPGPAKRVEFLSHTESKSPGRERASREPLPPDVISSVPHRHKKRRPRDEREPPTKPRPSRTAVPTATPGPVPEPPPAPPPPAPVESPPPPPATPKPPADGSEEFAPH